MIGPFVYKVVYWDTFENETKTKYGITFSDKYIHAVDEIVNHYGEDAIIVLEIQGLEPDTILELDEDVIENIVGGKY